MLIKEDIYWAARMIAQELDQNNDESVRKVYDCLSELAERGLYPARFAKVEAA